MIKSRFVLILSAVCWFNSLSAGVDMQAHIGSDEATNAYTDYIEKQRSYYSDRYQYSALSQKEGADLFALLNQLMGNTCRTASNGLNYNTLRNEYVNVDIDLNNKGVNIISFYSGRSWTGKWDSGTTWNREHVWPQSNGVSKDSPMGYDMLSVRPTITSENSSRGNKAYGEGSGYYDPDRDLSINNPNYNPANNGTYHGDCARIILYDYLTYGEMDGHKNGLYNGAAQLLSKLSTNSKSVFESLEVLLKWHMQDPPSLTEMVRNDGGQTYQGNRNPFIDYAELAIQMLKDNVSTFTVSYTPSDASVTPRYRYTLTDGFVCYITMPDGTHPQTITISDADYTYDPIKGRLTISNVENNIEIELPQPIHTTTASIEEIDQALIYDLLGNMLVQTKTGALNQYLQQLPSGIYIVRTASNTWKVYR